MFFLACSTSTAPSSYAGAAITSVNTSATCSAIATLTGRLVAITPPNADTGSQACARAWASAMSAPDRDAARVGVLDDRHRRRVEVVRGPTGGVGVHVVVVGHLLAVQLLRRREPAREGCRRRRAPPAGAGSPRSAARRPCPSSPPTQRGKPVPSLVSVTTLPIQDATATSYVAVCTNAAAASAWRSARREPAGGERRLQLPVLVGRGDHRDRRRGSSPRRGPSTDRRCRSARSHSSWLAPGAHGVHERVEVADQQVERRDPQLGQLVAVATRAGCRPAARRARTGAAS